jgi:hypothetical protein
MIETVFGDWVDRLQRVIDENGNYISYNIRPVFWD